MRNSLNSILREVVIIITVNVFLFPCIIIANTTFPEKEKNRQSDTIKNNLQLNKSIPFDTRISFEGGLSRRTAAISPELSKNMQEFYKNMKNGVYFFFNASTYLKNSGFEIGFNFSLSRFSYEDRSFHYYDSLGNLVAIGLITETVNIPMISPEFCYHRFFQNEKMCFNSGIFVGLTIYNDRITIIKRSHKIEGRTIGAGVFMGLDYIFYKNVALGISASYVYGLLGKIILDGNPITLGTKEEEGLQRIELSTGIKFYF